MAENVEFRVMPNGDSGWYLGSYYSGPTVIARGIFK
jgi:hypothetical protein